MTDARSTSGSGGGDPQKAVQSPAAGAASDLRRPGDDIPNRPQLKVRPRAAGRDASAPGPALRHGALVGAQKADVPASPDEPGGVSEDEKAIREAKTLVVPPVIAPEGRYPYATHGPAPANEEAEKAELDALNGRKPEREVSSGFLLGIALIVAVFVGGLMIARLGNKVEALENRISKLESPRLQTAALDRPAP